MFDPPQTIEAAKAYRYGEWAGVPRGYAFEPSCCAYEVLDGWLFRQCSRKPGKGPAGLYCGTHAKKAERKESE